MYIPEKKYHLDKYDRNGEIMINRNQSLGFSIIVPIKHSDISPLFITGDSDSDLYLIGPSQFENEPVEKIYKSLKCIPLRGGLLYTINSLIAHTNNDWLIITDTILEFGEDFFSKLKENVRTFSDTFQSFDYIILGQTIRERLRQIKWNNYIQGQNTRFQFINSPNIHTNFICIHKDFFRTLNGFDERYDLGNGYNFNNFLFRVLCYPSHQMATTMLDTFLMAYLKDEHDSDSFIKTNSLLWEYDKLEIPNGKIRAFNREQV